MKKDIKKKILSSIAFVRKELGFTLVSEDWGTAEHKCVCAMGAVLLQNDPKYVVQPGSKNERAVAAEILEVDEPWVDSFIDGFDGNGIAEQSPNPEAWEMGFAVAKETKPIVYYTWDGNTA